MAQRFSVEEQRIRAAYARRPLDLKYTWANPAHVHRLQSLERHVLTLFARRGIAPLHGKRILEIGCGRGHWLREFTKWGARPEDIVGLDLLAEPILDAKRLCSRGVHLVRCNAKAVALPDQSFDLIAQFTVFTSILDPLLKQQVALEMLRVLKPRGVILWYDFFVDNPRNPDVGGVGKRELRRLFPGCTLDVVRVTLAPPLADRLAARFPFLCTVLELIPLLRTHYLGTIRKP
jgi:SAM-dependent methyltransferase